MHITRIELENIKSYERFESEFQRGTTAITGSNGAGKTTLIEAVAWTLFDLLDYKKDDFVRRGAKKGVARVTFESSLDERHYTVYRDTGTGYYVFDQRLGARIADKKEEVQRFLWSHLGVEPGTDLESLFRRAIGVPQGTFTAIFLETASERKRAFDKLLKVEEYRLGSEKLLQTSRFVEQRINDASIKISRAEGELARFEIVRENERVFAAEASRLSEEIEKTERDLQSKLGELSVFDAAEKLVAGLTKKRDELAAAESTSRLRESQKKEEVRQSVLAAERIAAAADDHRTHLTMLERLADLEKNRAARDRIVDSQRRNESLLVTARAEQKALAEKIGNLERARTTIAELEPRIARQNELEAKRDELLKKSAVIKGRESEAARLRTKIGDLRDKFKTNRAEIEAAEKLAETAKGYENLRKRDEELNRSVSGLRARLEQDEQFQAEVRNGLCPILSEKCLNLKEGQTLEEFLSNRFVTVKAEILSIEAEQRGIADSLKEARDAERGAASLETLRRVETEITAEGKRLALDLEPVEREIAERDDVVRDLGETEKLIAELGDPRGRIRIFEAEVRSEAAIRSEMDALAKRLEALESESASITESLSVFAGIEEQWRTASGERDRTLAAHREYLVNEGVAAQLADREKLLNEATAALEAIAAEIKIVDGELLAAVKGYDADAHSAVKAAQIALDRRLTETKIHLANAERQMKEAADEIARLEKIRESLRDDFNERDRQIKILEATDFIRETLKKSAPLVAKNYIFLVSIEANQLYREISGRADQTLKWAEDYGILLEENGYERPFQSLSGGEQMSAALSVRLALLKQMTDIRLAFFDEPTTNMDAERRERLAEEISRIAEKQTFDQLFVISHDDTFEDYADHVLTVGE